MGNKLGEWTESYGSRSTKQKERIGFVKHYFPKAKVGEFVIQSGEITLGDEIIIIGKTTGLVQTKVSSIFLSKSNQQVTSAKKGDTITIPISELIRENDDLYLVSERKKLQINNKLK